MARDEQHQDRARDCLYSFRIRQCSPDCAEIDSVDQVHPHFTARSLGGADSRLPALHEGRPASAVQRAGPKVRLDIQRLHRQSAGRRLQ